MEGLSYFHWWLGSVGCSLLADVLYRGFNEGSRLLLHYWLAFSWDVCILFAHVVTEDYRLIFLAHACKVAYMFLSRPRQLMKIVQVDAYHALAFFVIIHGGAELGLETFDLLAWEMYFHCLTLAYNAVPLLKEDRPIYIWALTLAWGAVRVVAFAWRTRGSWYHATVVATQALVVVSLIK